MHSPVFFRETVPLHPTCHWEPSPIGAGISTKIYTWCAGCTHSTSTTWIWDRLLESQEWSSEKQTLPWLPQVTAVGTPGLLCAVSLPVEWPSCLRASVASSSPELCTARWLQPLARPKPWQTITTGLGTPCGFTAFSHIFALEPLGASPCVCKWTTGALCGWRLPLLKLSTKAKREKRVKP